MKAKKQAPVVKGCKECSESFISWVSSNQQFCSRRCWYLARKQNVALRFWPKVDIKDDDECWEWLGGKSGGYGMFWDGVSQKKAHRIAWELWNERPFPSNRQGNHTCDNPPCCNPRHVYPGTAKENTSDMFRRDRAVTVRGAECVWAKLTDTDVIEIRERYSNGERGASLAERFSISPQHAVRVATRQMWKHV